MDRSCQATDDAVGAVQFARTVELRPRVVRAVGAGSAASKSVGMPEGTAGGGVGVGWLCDAAGARQGGDQLEDLKPAPAAPARLEFGPRALPRLGPRRGKRARVAGLPSVS